MTAISDTLIMCAVDALAIGALVFAAYYPRHRRADMVVSFLGVNVGVFAIASILTGVDIGMGLGIGLFGVLSIIRLRSTEISQREVAYYFAALAIGLIAGVSSFQVIPVALLVAIVVVVSAADAFRPMDSQEMEMVVDRAIADPAQLRAYVASLLGAPVTRVTTLKLDVVNDLTIVRVAYRGVSAPAQLPVAAGEF